MHIGTALAQMPIATGDPAANYRAAEALAARAATEDTNLLVLPELWATGHDLARAQTHATPVDAGHFALMAALAAKHRLHVAGTALESNPGGRPFNTAVVFGPDGSLVGAYRKVHLFAPMGEARYLAAGDSLPVFEMPWGRTALAICYDLRFPELWRRYADAGAVFIIIPAAWPERRIDHWQLLLRARAVENQLFVAGCNRAGTEGAFKFGGRSSAIDPWGRVLAGDSASPGLYSASLDLGEVARARQLFTFLEDRRPAVCA